jgi:DNA-binding transcriptional ArsR family regulator
MRRPAWRVLLKGYFALGRTDPSTGPTPRDARVVDLTGMLGLAQSTVSRHLACLRDCGLVTVRAAGRASVYSLTQPALLDVFTAAEAVLAAGQPR